MVFVTGVLVRMTYCVIACVGNVVLLPQQTSALWSSGMILALGSGIRMREAPCSIHGKAPFPFCFSDFFLHSEIRVLSFLFCTVMILLIFHFTGLARENNQRGFVDRIVAVRVLKDAYFELPLVFRECIARVCALLCLLTAG